MQLLNRVLNGQAMAVPARDVLRIKARELPAFDDHVFEHFVERVPNVQLAIGVGWTVVEHKEWGTGSGQAKLLINAVTRPLLGPSRLALGQVPTHGKRGVWQVERGSVVCGLGHGSAAKKAKALMLRGERERGG